VFLSAILPSIAHAIEAPRDTRGTVVRPSVIKWEWSNSSGATRYQVNVNGAFVSMTKDTFFYSRNLSPGDYTFTVQAVDGNGRYSSRSSVSAVRTIGGRASNNSSASSTIPAPNDPRGTLVRPAEIKWEWSKVNGADQYEVFVDNKPVGLTNKLFVYTPNLSSGEHSMVVKAVDGNGARSGNSSIARLTISGGSNNSNATANSSNGNNSLPAPKDPRGTRVRPGEIKWEHEKVAGASEYEYTVNGTAYRTSSLYLYTKNLPAGEHTMTVRALTSDGRKSASSKQAKASTSANPSGGSSNSNGGNAPSVASGGIPTNIRGTRVGDQEARWEWRTVSGATGYQIYLDGASAGVTQDDNFYAANLSTGNHTVKVAAIDSVGKHSDQSVGATVSIEGKFADSGNGVAPPPPSDDNGLIDPASWNYSEVSQKPGYRLVFSDEFNTNTLNRNRWNTQLRWDGSHNGDRYEYRLINKEAQFYVNPYSQDQEHLDKIASVYNPFEFNGSRLAIRAVKNPLKDRNTNNQFGALDTIYRQQPFLSGVISSYGKFYQKYGYFEARIKIPAHEGTFPAFWLHHQRTEKENTQKNEIDIMENLGHNPHYVYTDGHYYNNVSEHYGGDLGEDIKPQPNGQIFTGTIYTDDYHVYAAEWDPGQVRFYIDGQQVSKFQRAELNHEELYITLNLAVGGEWTNKPKNQGGNGRPYHDRFPNQQDINEWRNPALEIDYVRAYKRQ